MRAFLLSIGDELLIGQTVNTNVAWLGRELSMRGYEIIGSEVVRDVRSEMEASFENALTKADLVIVTGGLGPTQDDMTKDVLCDYFETELVLNQEVLDRVTDFFTKRGREMLEVNRRQAYLPKAAKILRNDMGTASGMWFEKDSRVLISLPGVPYEMKFIMESSGFYLLKDHFNAKSIYYRTIQVQGIGESFLADRISDIETAIRKDGIGLAYLPQPGLVRLRLSGSDTPEVRDAIASYIEEILAKMKAYAFDSEKTLSAFVGNKLRQEGKTLSTVESCTGGALAAEIVSVSGSSDYYKGSIVSYANEIKSGLVGVDEKLMHEFGAVSQEVVTEMAAKGRTITGTDFCLATSGIAGPDGGTDEKPVGMVWIAIAGEKGTWSKRFQFGTERERNIRMTVLTALNLLRCELYDIDIEKS